MSRLVHSPVLRSFCYFILALMLLAFAGLFITSHTHGGGSGSASNTSSPAAYFDPTLYTPEQLSFSSINDGIPDVWKEYYGFSLGDPGLAQADYNGTGTSNLFKYLSNLWPLDTAPPQPPATLPKAAPKPTTTAKARTTSVSAAGATALPTPPLLANGTFSARATLDHASKNGYGGITFNWGYNTSINGWKPLHGSLIEIWSVHGNQFVELDTKIGSYGIKQQVVNAKAGTYLLKWKHRGRDSALAGNNAYRAFVYSETNGELSRVTLKETHFPVSPLVVSKTAWQPQVMAFTVTDADLAAAGGAQKSLWIAFEPDGNNSYGALIDDVSLAPVEVDQPTINSDGTAGELAAVDSIRMCRWESPRNTQTSILLNRGEFPQHDKDRFIIRLPLGHRGTTSTIRVTVSTTGAVDNNFNDSGHQIEFKEQGNSGVFVSKPMALVVDSGDNGVRVGNTAAGALNHPTFITRPGCKLRLTCAELGSNPIEIPVKNYSHRIRYKQIFAGQISGDNVATALFENLWRFPEIYNQVHIRLDEEHGQAQIPKDDPNLLAIYQDKKVTPDELPAIIAKVNALSLPDNVVKVIWVPKGIVGKLGDRGESVHGFNLGSNGRKDIVLLFLSGLSNTAVTATDNAQTLSHEVGHALRGGDHNEKISPYNPLPKYHLMANFGGNPTRDASPDSSGKHWYVRESEANKIPPAESLAP